jgi:hypothetical protein
MGALRPDRTLVCSVSDAPVFDPVQGLSADRRKGRAAFSFEFAFSEFRASAMLDDFGSRIEWFLSFSGDGYWDEFHSAASDYTDATDQVLSLISVMSKSTKNTLSRAFFKMLIANGAASVHFQNYCIMNGGCRGPSLGASLEALERSSAELKGPEQWLLGQTGIELMVLFAAQSDGECSE